MKEVLSFIHLHANRANSKTGLILLFMPALVFFIVLTIFLFEYRGEEIISSLNKADILGVQKEILDINR